MFSVSEYTYLRTSGIVKKNNSCIGKNNIHHTCAKNPPSGRSQGYLTPSASSSVSAQIKLKSGLVKYFGSVHIFHPLPQPGISNAMSALNV